MADSPIYENPNGRKRRAARGSTHFRDYVKKSKDDMEKLAPSLKYNTVEQAANITGRDVTAPWADGANFRSGIGEGRTTVDYGYDKKEIQEFIQETARVAKEDYGLNNINVNTVYGLDDSLDGMEGQFTWNTSDVNNNHIDIYTDTIWKNTALDGNGNLLEDGVERFKERIKYTIGHEMRHQWQHTTEEGKAIEEVDDVYKQTKINDYTDDYDKYYYEPVEVDARYNGEKFRKTYELKSRKYKEKLEQQGFNEGFRNKIEEINLRPKNRIIGHQFEKEPIDISSYRKFDNVEPIDWDIDTGKKSPIDKYDVSKNNRYKNAKLNKGQKSLRPKSTMSNNNLDIDSIYNYNAPHKTITKPKKKYQSRSKTFNMDDGSVVKQYYDKNGNVRSQVRTWQDGRREVRRQHTAKTIAKDPKAKNMSAVVSTYDGETTEIHRRPNGNYFSTTKINHQTGEIETVYNKRIHPWGGNISEQQVVNTTINEQHKIHNEKMNKKYGLEDIPDPEPYKPKIGDNIIESKTGERYVLKAIDEADPSLDIHSDTYYYVSPNGDRITQSTPIDPTNPNGKYFLDDEILTPDDVYRINHSFEELRMNYDNYEQAKGQLYNLKDAYENGADNLNEIYEMEKSVRYLEKKLAETRKQIYDDDSKYNSGDKWAYNINEKTQKYIDKTDNVLKNYSETKYNNNYNEVFKDVKPRQIIKSIEPGIDNAINVPNNTTVNNNIKNSTKRVRGKKKGQSTGRGGKKKAVNSTGRINKNTIKSGPRKAPALRRRVAKGKSSTLKAIGRNGKVLNNIPRVKVPLSKKDVIKTAANLIVNEAATNTANTIIKNVDEVVPDTIPTPEAPIPDNAPDGFNIPDGYSDDPMTWTDEDIKDMANGDQDIYDELKKRRDNAFANEASDPNSDSNNPETPTPEPEPPEPMAFSDDFDPNDPSTWTDSDRKRMNDPSIWTDDDIKRMADGDGEYADDLIRRRLDAIKGETTGPSNKIPGQFEDAPVPNTYHIDAPDTEIENFDDLGGVKKLGVVDKVMTGVNILGAVGDYKTARREGHGVVSSAVRAGAKFAVDEALGLWAIPVALVKTAPGLAIKGADMLYKENRRMNSAANFQLFGDAQFMDTQQLATMRQSGMEMAKMAQYNLQQTLMGNEATYLHR